MKLKKEQSKKYMEEAELSLYSAEAVFDKAKEEDKDLWANVVKSCYDAIEQAISSAIAAKEERIPIQHPEKIIRFNKIFKTSKDMQEKIFFWLGRRSSAQYVDIKHDKISVPHELFTEEDAKKAIDESKEIIEEIKKTIEEGQLREFLMSSKDTISLEEARKRNRKNSKILK